MLEKDVNEMDSDDDNCEIKQSDKVDELPKYLTYKQVHIETDVENNAISICENSKKLQYFIPNCFTMPIYKNQISISDRYKETNNDISIENIPLSENSIDYISSRLLHKMIFSSFNRKNCRRDFTDTSNYKQIKESGKTIVGIFFSGGYDSSYLLLKALEKGYYIIPIVNLYNREFIDHSLLIMLSIETILNKYNEIYKDHVFATAYNLISQLGNINGNGLSQQPLTALGVMKMPAIMSNNLKEIQIGYINGDNGITFIKELKTIYNMNKRFSAAFLNAGPYDNVKFPKLTFPLQRISKDVILCNLHNDENYYEISELPFITCEDPKINTFIQRRCNKKDNTIKYYLIIEYKSCDMYSKIHKCMKCEEMKSYGRRSVEWGSFEFELEQYNPDEYATKLNNIF